MTLALSCVIIASFLLLGCNNFAPKNSGTQTVNSSKPEAKIENVSFTDVAEKSGVKFKHVRGDSKHKWLPETMGSGVAWIDYDGDGYQDLFFVNSREWTPEESKKSKSVSLTSSGNATCKLFHNNKDGTFTDVTEKARLNIPLYGMGVCVGDYDNDGKPDLYVTGLGRNYLFHNNGNGTFSDVSEKSGVKDGGWSSSAAWVDYDKDGKLDLVVCHYVDWSPANDIPFLKNGHASYGTPNQYLGQPLTLYHNEGNGRFTEVAQKSGLRMRGDGLKAQGKSLGVVICDYDNDGLPDIAVSNDTEPNYLFHNKGKGEFEEVGQTLGMAVPDNGQARGAMGIDACDYDRKGNESIVIGNFSNQMLTLYHNEKGNLFRDVASQSGVGQPSLLSLSFGCFFFDLDNDGWQDLFIANGHIDDDIQEDQKLVEYAEKPLIYLNLKDGNFKDVSAQTGSLGDGKYVARGCAAADYDLSGNVSIAMSSNAGVGRLFKNGGTANRSLRLELEGVKSNRSAIGARVTVATPAGSQLYTVRSGSSYCSQSELPITVGLGKEAMSGKISIHWPSGEVSELGSLEAGQFYRVVEGKGVGSKTVLGITR